MGIKDKPLEHVVAFSGGKDSTAMLLMLLEKGYPVDEVIFADTGIEFPQMYEHIDKVERFTGIKITRLKGLISFEEGLKKYGWPQFYFRWCTGRFKTTPVQHHLKGRNYRKAIGFAYDEIKRINPKNKKDWYPLIEWKVTEADALKYCLNRGFDWGGLYEHFSRLSCYACPLARINNIRSVYKYFPDLWEKMLYFDDIALKGDRRYFHGNKSVHDFDERFKKEEQEDLFKEDK